MFGRGMFNNFFTATETKIKKTKITRKYGPDGKIVEEVVETTENASTPEDRKKVVDETEKDSKKVDDFFTDMDNAFNKLWGK